MKRCCVCKADKPSSEFHRNKGRKDGLSETCKECAKARARAWHAMNRDRHRAKTKAYAQRHRAESIARSRAWYLAHREEVLAAERKRRRGPEGDVIRSQDRTRAKTPSFKDTRRRYRMKNVENLRAAKRASYQRRKAYALAASAAYRRRHPEKMRVRANAWRLANPEKRRAIAQRYDERKRAARYGTAATLTQEQWKSILNTFGHRCAYCDRPRARLEKEHLRPLSRGGHTTADNIVPACRSCNAGKHKKLPLEWIWAATDPVHGAWSRSAF